MLTLSQIATQKKHIKVIFETQNMRNAQLYIGGLYPEKINLAEYNLLHVYLSSLEKETFKMEELLDELRDAEIENDWDLDFYLGVLYALWKIGKLKSILTNIVR